ncbi:hypothetical protein BBK82_10165 [Lentzea guizhouensis]|uniref:Mo-co oxidoreductase dimerization domain protein n=1 Tax=Lentzea guizhouensis TaxID=1586287 RepID=A0A1B2HF91_9PSEU|nr:DUF4082 domain-containing protein [Lentzea guizhouensis]ANZ36372.1 hypothetical protein BBK82_10165 [Lentzea guizhouensis]
MPNLIVTENQLPGSPKSEWDGINAAVPADPNIAGFTTRLSVNKGQTIDFKIHTNSSNYRIDIYRLGYYGGAGARKVHSIQRNTPSVQPAAFKDNGTGLWDASNWSVTTSWAVPASTVSGVFLAKLVRQDGTPGASHIPFVVRDDGAQRDMVFQTADTTWHAYNGWGGANLYGGEPASGRPEGRAFKVSYNRPYSTRVKDGGTFAGPQDFVLSAEYAMIRWLERNGYDVAYVTGVDVGPGNYDLTNHDVYLSVGHDEYWSREQREHVEAARDAGVHLCFFSGNEVYWKVRWEPDVGGTPNRTLVCYKETRNVAKLDPSPEWTGTWRDPAFSPPSDGGAAENRLTGTSFSVDSHQADRIEVPASCGKLRFWRNTGMALLPPGQTGFIEDGVLGYEWDESPDNRFRPPTLIKLSQTNRFITQRYLVDYGLTTGDGNATHHLTLYKAPSGALVFGAGTVFWSFALDTVHDYTSSDQNMPAVPEDRDAQQATVNLFADMGVQPETLQGNLTPATASTDTTPPVTVITSPANGATLTQQAQVTISGTASDAGGIVATVEVSTDNGQTWRVATGTTSWSINWWPQLPGTYTIRARAIDDSLNVENGPTRTVTVTPAGSVRLFQPTDVPYGLRTHDQNPVELGMRFSVNTPGSATALRFYKNPFNLGTHVGRLYNASGTKLAEVTYLGESASGWQQVDIAPIALNPGETYTVTVHTAKFYNVDYNYFHVPRTCGAVTAPADAGVFRYGTGTMPTESFLRSNYWVDVVFARAGGAGTLPPTAVGNSGFTTPAGTALTIPAATLLANDSDPNGYPISMVSAGSATGGTVSFNSGTQNVTFTPTGGFSGSASFQYTITNGFLQASTTVNLSVGVPLVTQSLFTLSDTPAMQNSNDNGPVELGVKFRCTVPGANATGVRFFKGTLNTGPHSGRLWNATTGALLATATFSGESSSGWQSANFPAPVPLTQNQLYIVSYHTTTKYSVTESGLAADRVSGQLVAPASGSAGGNGVFTYGAAGGFPVSSSASANYFVDVVAAVPAQPQVPVSLFGPSDVPAIVNSADVGPVELGVKFRTTSANATATGIRFYKGSLNTGTHVAHLWNATTQQLLATATFSGETASGWQQVNFASAVPLTPNTTYIAAYHTTTHYSVTNGYYGNARVVGSLSAPSSASAGGNGVFAYGPAGSFPASSVDSTNYWVDVVVQSG